jgi:hypothetical protein
MHDFGNEYSRNNASCFDTSATRTTRRDAIRICPSGDTCWIFDVAA